MGGLGPGARHVLAFMSPEEALGERAGAQSDLFSLGAMLYELLTGSSAFERVTADETLLAVLQLTPAPVEHVPPALAGIVTRALAKPLDRRYRSAAQLATDLRTVQETFDAEIAAIEAAGASAGSRWLWWAAGLAAVALGVAGWLTL
jgi:serine/threonine protein kinase